MAGGSVNSVVFTEYIALLSEVVLAATVKLIDTLHEAEKSLIAAKGGAISPN